MEFYLIAVHIPLAVTLTLILGALIRANMGRRNPRGFGTVAVTFLSVLILWSYSAPINLVLAAILFLFGIGASATAALTSPKRLLLIEPIVFPICLITVVMVDTWF